MIPFREASDEIFKAFFDQLYKTCRYSEELQQVQIDALEKVMHQKMMEPSELFESITSNSQTEQTQQPVAQEMQEKVENCKRGKPLISNQQIYADNEDQDYEDDLDGMNQSQNRLLPFKLNNSASYCLNQTHLSSSLKTGKNESIFEQDQCSLEESQNDSYENHLTKAVQACSKSRDYCRFHIGGIYNEKLTRFRANTKMQYISTPLLLIKDRRDFKQYVMTNCQYALKYGEIDELFELLNGEALSRKREG